VALDRGSALAHGVPIGASRTGAIKTAA